jgi:hypothetical protein
MPQIVRCGRHVSVSKSSLGIGEAEIDKMAFPALSLEDAIGAFTTAACGKPLKFQQERTTTEGLGQRRFCPAAQQTRGACYPQPAPDGQLRGHIELGP